MGNTAASKHAEPLLARLRPMSVEHLDAAAAKAPFSSLHEPDGAIIMLVRRMG